MKNLTLGDFTIPALGFGTYKLTGRNCVDGVGDALQIGYRHIDTAQFYQNEEEVGTAIRQSGIERENIFLTTKIWRDQLSYDDVIKSTDVSLHKLNADYIDLLLIHWWDFDFDMAETLDAMAACVEKGWVKHIGVSNFNTEYLEEAFAKTPLPIVCNQVEMHPFLAQKTLRKAATGKTTDGTETAIKPHVLTGYSPLALGNVLDDPTLKTIARKHGKSAAQITLRWFMQLENVACIPKAGSHKHRLSNFDIFSFELDAEDMASINALDRDKKGRLIDPVFAPEWD